MNRHLHMLLNCHETWKVEPLLIEGDARRSSPQSASYLVTPLDIFTLVESIIHQRTMLAFLIIISVI